MLEPITERLAFYGYKPSVEDETALTFLLSKTEDHVKNFCNLTTVPEELKSTVVECVTLEFLQALSLSGRLDDVNITVDKVSSISEGDVSISYASNSSKQTLSDACEKAKNQLDAGLLPFRRMRW